MSGSVKVRVPGMELELEEMGAMGYQQTLMYGRYSRSLSDQIKEEAKRHQLVENRSKEYKSLIKGNWGMLSEDSKSGHFHLEAHLC